MRAILVIFLFSQFPVSSFGSDTNACNVLAEVVSLNQDRFDQAEIALKSKNEICEKEEDAVKCSREIESEYLDSKTALEKSKFDYQKAGCDQ